MKTTKLGKKSRVHPEISEHFSRLGKKSWFRRKAKILESAKIIQAQEADFPPLML